MRRPSDSGSAVPSVGRDAYPNVEHARRRGRHLEPHEKCELSRFQRRGRGRRLVAGDRLDGSLAALHELIRPRPRGLHLSSNPHRRPRARSDDRVDSQASVRTNLAEPIDRRPHRCGGGRRGRTFDRPPGHGDLGRGGRAVAFPGPDRHARLLRPGRQSRESGRRASYSTRSSRADSTDDMSLAMRSNPRSRSLVFKTVSPSVLSASVCMA